MKKAHTRMMTLVGIQLTRTGSKKNTTGIIRNRNRMEKTVRTMTIRVDLATGTPARFMNISMAMPPPPCPGVSSARK